jgi:glycosyltransferase involved in cell wall biosynthesis
VTSGHDVSDARIHRLCAALQDAGLAVELLGLGAPAGSPDDVPTTARPRPGLAGRAATAARYAARAQGTVLVALDPDSLLASLVVARLRGRKVVADVHEDYAALLADRPWADGWKGRVARVLVAGATRTARSADLVIVADEHVPPLSGRRRVVLRNLPYPGMLPVPSAPGLPRRALYIGDVRATRGLWTMIEALEQAPDWFLDIVGPVSAADEPRLTAYLADGPARDRLRIHGRRPPREAWHLAAGAACGLVLLDDTPAFRDALPSKLYEYVASGLPVVVTDLPRQREFVEAHGVGAIVPTGEGCPNAVATVLNAWSSEPEALASLRERTAAFRATADEWVEAYAVAAAAVKRLVSP